MTNFTVNNVTSGLICGFDNTTVVNPGNSTFGSTGNATFGNGTDNTFIHCSNLSLVNNATHAKPHFTEQELNYVCTNVLCYYKYQSLTTQCMESRKLSIVLAIEREKLYTEHMPTPSKVVLSILFSLIMIASLCGNSLVVMTFIANKHMRSVTNVFILSLAVSDLMVTITCIPIDLGTILSKYWIFGKFGCKLIPCLMQFAVTCSSITLCCIAFDRYYAIVYPLKLKFLQTTQRAVFLQVIVWAISAASSFPYLTFSDTIEIQACENAETKYTCLSNHNEATRKIFVEFVTLFVLFLGPFIFISVMYAIICFKLWFQGPIGAGSQRPNDSRLRIKRKVIKMLITVVVIFVICWSPLLLFNGIAEIRELPNTMSTLRWRDYLQCLSLSSTCWNPIVYAFMNEKFRKAFKTILTCRKGRVYPVFVRSTAQRMSTESRKTTTQLEPTSFRAMGTTQLEPTSGRDNGAYNQNKQSTSESKDQ